MAAGGREERSYLCFRRALCIPRGTRSRRVGGETKSSSCWFVLRASPCVHLSPFPRKTPEARMSSAGRPNLRAPRRSGCRNRGHPRQNHKSNNCSIQGCRSFYKNRTTALRLCLSKKSFRRVLLKVPAIKF